MEISSLLHFKGPFQSQSEKRQNAEDNWTTENSSSKFRVEILTTECRVGTDGSHYES